MRLGVSLAAAVLAVVFAQGEIALAIGPRLAMTEFGGKPLALELKSVGPDGSSPLQIAGGGRRARPLPAPLEVPSWSPDGASIAFAAIGGTLAGTQGFVTEDSQIFVASEDGSGLRALPGTTGGMSPVFAPDGRTIAFARQRRRTRKNDRGGEDVRNESATVWLTDVQTGATTRITPWRRWVRSYPTSFSPDSSTLLLIRRADRDGPSAIVATRVDGGGAVVLARGASDGVYSPDGSEIAFLRTHVQSYGKPRSGESGIETTSDLYAMRSDGSRARRLTRTPTGIEVWPSWDPSGERLAYTRLRGGSLQGFLGIGDTVLQVNSDGSCPSTIFAPRRGVAYYGASWQPGPGREAGRIAC